ncbi:polyphenol oxidase family protein [Campylobacter sp. TTU-622]|uniref:polyphenol oxidase family protein n=1 Tax=unclassified Campylobacter TaxID=2593542 RepID=UPI001908A765|nr:MULTISPECIES: polyphenol oxidase family protein [unclassified Campylobacter]MBK1971007.1 polyphenol oxidase family protein [Campylobacter sp. TTU_617]MBK1973925.1 polyphenol oxidase family protein [Campylobacter sp. TTU-622]MBK1991374.1 polyphenol oxidase family protein [Campylobacter sp. 2018MI34]
MGRSGENFLSLLDNEQVSIFCAYDKDYSPFKAKILNENLFSDLGFKNIKQCVFMNQIHSNKVEIFTKSFTNFSCDGIISTCKNTALCVLSADCLPLLLWHKSGIIAGLHSGRKGTFENILKESIDKFHLLNPSIKNEEINLFIAPSICQKNYEIKDELLSFSQKYFKDFIKNSRLDLKAIVKKQAKDLRINNIKDCNICTFDDKRFFSYRREQTNKRFVSVIVLKDLNV